ncbi:hypothetical protein [Streptomyces sp. VRA16 Mangrove soil]|uniref:hypothetical protein n=1 Tax=Streptomyces sp. VRA16 Mangrove soil TaxID=2817434 RepID=UPI001A9EB0EA|nr:hypothetical protein [Streptomyces sp. VRA16 Mangrove soil]MBO1334437.1 hypothetical protein [Streptomyces sp. VRA16 Mangrove soil]
MAEPEFTATGVQIGRRLRSLTRAGQIRITGGRLELLTSYGSEIDSAPLGEVRAGKPWFGSDDRATAEVDGRRYLLRLGGGESGDAGPPAARRFIDAVRKAAARAT